MGKSAFTSGHTESLTLTFPVSLPSNPQLDFVAAPALRPAEVEIDAAQQAIYEKELEAAAAAPLPDEVSICA